jgi:hypothetical protein
MVNKSHPCIRDLPTYDEMAEIVEAEDVYETIEEDIGVNIDGEFITDSWIRGRKDKQARMMFLFGAAFTLMSEIVEEQNPDERGHYEEDNYFTDFHDLYNHVQVEIDKQVTPNSEGQEYFDEEHGW